MRSIHLLAATCFIALGASACGDDGGTGINPPVANFTQQCTELACNFDDQSTGSITSWSWIFGDVNSATNTSTDQNPTHTFSAAGTYNVTLTVTDGTGASNSKTNAVTVGSTTGNTPPTASFDVPICTGTTCSFHSTSTDVDNDIVATQWNFGEPTSPSNTATTGDATHTYNVTAPTPFTVTLTVTDDDGATNTATQTITVSPATAANCTPVGTTDFICNLTLSQRSIVTITLDDEDCELGGNRVSIPPPEPRAQNVFTNVCSQPVTPVDYTLLDPAGAPLVFEAGTVLPVQFHRGEPGLGDPPAGAPTAMLESTSANTWTISIDDGGNTGAPGEPDFTDVLLTVVATPQ